MSQDKPVDWSDLKPDVLNANKGTERGMHLLRHSMEQYGPGGALTVDADGNVIGGNKTQEVAMEMGLEPVLVDIEPHQVLVARRKDLHLYGDDPTARNLATALNRVAQVNLAFSDAMLEAAEERGSTARTELWLAHELVAMAQEREQEEEAEEADAAKDGEDVEPLDPKPRHVQRFPVLVTCQDESERAELIEWLDARDIKWRLMGK